MSGEREYVIWSHEHGMWWRPDNCGYTVDLNEAGLYTVEQAADIVIDVIPPGQEVAMHVKVAERYGPTACYGYDFTKDRTRLRA